MEFVDKNNFYLSNISLRHDLILMKNKKGCRLPAAFFIFKYQISEKSI